MYIEKLTKISNDKYEVESMPCPFCGTTFTTTLDASQFQLLEEGAHVQKVFSHLSADDRERFVSGLCPDEPLAQ